MSVVDPDAWASQQSGDVARADPMLIEARAQYGLLGRRADLLGEGFANDPIWNIMLDVFIAERRRRSLSVSAVCIGSRASPATAMRYLEKLCAAGMLTRRCDPNDARRTFITLSPHGSTSMEVLLRRDACVCME